MAVYDLTASGVTLTNLILDPSVELGQWGGATVDTSTALYGSRSIKLPAGTSVPSIGIPTPIVGHKYYGRRYIKTSGNSTAADARFEIFAGDGYGLNWVLDLNMGNYLDWTLRSNIATIEAVNGSSYVIRSFHVNGTADVWQDGFMLIDLTASYGAGNEPTLKWCDENIPYFEGTIRVGTVGKLNPADILNCPYSGDSVGLVLPKGVYQLEVWGAEGGKYNTSSVSGKGGYAKGTLTLSEWTTLHLYAGGQGTGAKTAGGFNGGGSTKSYGGSGGGGSDIRINSTSLYARCLVAGGGGGAGFSTAIGGYGGGLTGGQGGNGSATGGDGGTQTSGGTNNTPGSFGNANSNTSNGGGGGGGWYGGSSGWSSDTDSGGGGGSGYAFTSITATNYPTGCLLDASHYLTDTLLSAGNISITLPTGTSSTGNSGSGYIRITVLSIDSINLNVKIGGTWKKASKLLCKIDGTWKVVPTIYYKVSDVWHTG